MLSALFCEGQSVQSPDSAPNFTQISPYNTPKLGHLPTGTIVNDSLQHTFYVGGTGTIAYREPSIVYDTSKVLMLVADTGYVISEDIFSLNNKIYTDVGRSTDYTQNQVCFWIIGYRVLQSTKEFATYHPSYYDSNWKKLPSTYYVWQSVIIK